MADLTTLLFSAVPPTGDAPPALTILVAPSAAFSQARSVKVPYWAFGHEQTWINLSRQSADEVSSKTIELSPFARSGTNEIRAITMVDVTGLEMHLSSAQLSERGIRRYRGTG